MSDALYNMNTSQTHFPPSHSSYVKIQSTGLAWRLKNMIYITLGVLSYEDRQHYGRTISFMLNLPPKKLHTPIVVFKNLPNRKKMKFDALYFSKLKLHFKKLM